MRASFFCLYMATAENPRFGSEMRMAGEGDSWFALLGRKSGWQRYFASLIRILGEKTRTRDVFSASHPDFWGDFPDECRSSIHLGKIMGKKWPRCIKTSSQNIVWSTAWLQNRQNAVKVFPGRHKSECFPMCNPSRRKSECFTICYTNKHKPRSASL